MNAIRPTRRFKLQAKIIGAGFPSITAFAERVNADQVRLSRVISGWELPAPGLQEKIATGLGINREELVDLLEA